MAKYCKKCGRQLPEGQEYCPICHVEGQTAEAAPFTSISAETESWNTRRGKHEKNPRTELQRQTLWYSVGATLVVIAAAALILFIQPVNRVIRALNAGDFDRAGELFWSDSKLSAGDYGEELDRAILRAAQRVCEDYAAHRLSSEEVSAALARLEGIGVHEELLNDIYAQVRKVSGSQGQMDRAKAMEQAGNYLDAWAEYLEIAEDDPDYAAAQTAAAACLEQYEESVIAEANLKIQTEDYAGAILTLRQGWDVLIGYDVFSQALDYKLQATYSLYDAQLLDQAAEAAAVEDFNGAAALLEAGMDRFDRRPAALTEAVTQYRSQAGGKSLADAIAEAERLAGYGDWTAAFARLEAAEAEPQLDQEEVRAAITQLEERFAQDRLDAAAAALNGSRENVAQASELISAALQVRSLDALRDYQRQLAQYLPASLADIDYTDKNGAVFRNSGVFEGLDGVSYYDGWIWGENGAEVSYTLNGNYDLLEGVLSVRRNDTVQATGYFEIYCDDTLVYVSEALHHPDAVSSRVSTRISGCRVLKIRFVNDYSVRSADDGYCYHGFCSPTLTKDLPE